MTTIRNTVHTFTTTGEAYDETQCRDEIATGDTLTIAGEGVVGLAWAWPVAVTAAHGVLHRLDGTTAQDAAKVIADARWTDDQIAQAISTAEDSGFPLAAWAADWMEQARAARPVLPAIPERVSVAFDLDAAGYPTRHRVRDGSSAVWRCYGDVVDIATGRSYRFALAHGWTAPKPWELDEVGLTGDTGRNLPAGHKPGLRAAVLCAYREVFGINGRTAMAAGWRPLLVVSPEDRHLTWHKDGMPDCRGPLAAITAEARAQERAERDAKFAALKQSAIWQAYRARRASVPWQDSAGRNAEGFRMLARRAVTAHCEALALVYPAHGGPVHVPSAPPPPGPMGAPWKVGPTETRFSENPASHGFRLVGMAGELVTLKHTGWYVTPDDDAGEIARGAVFQLPSRNGRALFVPAILDPYRDGCAMLALGDVHEAPAQDESATEDARRSAAYAADELARIYAEGERDHSEAFQAGSNFAELRHTARAEGRLILTLLQERKRAIREGFADRFPRVLENLEATVREHLEQRRANYGAARTLWTACPRELEPAFLDGAGLEAAPKTATL